MWSTDELSVLTAVAVCYILQIDMGDRKVYDGLSVQEMKNLLDLIYNDVPKETFLVAGMHPIHRAKLNKNRPDLVSDLDADRVIDHLMASGVFKEYDKNTVLSCSNVRETQNRELLSKLQTKGPTAYQEFRKSLSATGSHLVAVLDTTVLVPQDFSYTGNVSHHSAHAVPVTTSPTATVTPAVITTTTTAPVVTHPSTTPTTTPTVTVPPVVFSRPPSSRKSRPLASLVQPLGEHTVGVINFVSGVVKQLKCGAKTWENTDISLHPDLLPQNLDWTYRLCAEGDGKVYVLIL